MKKKSLIPNGGWPKYSPNLLADQKELEKHIRFYQKKEKERAAKAFAKTAINP